MGSKGEFFGGLLGAAIVGIPGLTALTAFQGFQLGSALGAMFAPSDSGNSSLGRLSDVRTSGSSQGVGIPIIYGRQREGCIIAYMSAITESTHSEGGGKK